MGGGGEQSETEGHMQRGCLRQNTVKNCPTQEPSQTQQAINTNNTANHANKYTLTHSRIEAHELMAKIGCGRLWVHDTEL